MIGPAKIYFIVFGLFTIVGGLMGYLKAGSTASLVAGSVSGILLLVAAFLLPNYLVAGLALAAVVSIALAGRFVPAFLNTGKPTCSRARANACDPRMSQWMRRRSKSSELPKRSKISLGPDSKRPPQSFIWKAPGRAGRPA
jgi:uncharacterized membrane protein (UPF0136 family)